MAYPTKLRERALQAVRNGHSKTEVREMFGLGVNTLKAWEDLETETGSLKNRELSRTAYKIDREQLLKWYRENPYSTDREAAIVFNCSISGIRSSKKVLGITRKKTPLNTVNATNKSGKSSSLK